MCRPEECRDLERLRKDKAEQFLVIAAPEGQHSRDHLIHYHTYTPPVDGLAVIAILYDFRRQVFWGAAEGRRAIAICHVFFAQAKVRNLDMSVAVKHQVLKLQVPVDDTL